MENIKNVIKTISGYLILLVCIALILIGHRNIGYLGASTMLIGLSGILIMLYFYNRKYR